MPVAAGITRAAWGYQWPGVRDRYQAKSVVPKRQAPTSRRDHLRARPAGHKAETLWTLRSRSALAQQPLTRKYNEVFRNEAHNYTAHRRKRHKRQKCSQVTSTFSK